MTTQTELRCIANQEQVRLERNRRAREGRAINKRRAEVDRIVTKYTRYALRNLDAKMLEAAAKGETHLSLLESRTEHSNDPDYSGFSGSRTDRHEHHDLICDVIIQRLERRGLSWKFMSLGGSGLPINDEVTGLCVVWS